MFMNSDFCETNPRNKRWYHKCLGILSIWTPSHSLRQELSAKIEIFRKPSVMQPFVVPGEKNNANQWIMIPFHPPFSPFQERTLKRSCCQSRNSVDWSDRDTNNTDSVLAATKK